MRSPLLIASSLLLLVACQKPHLTQLPTALPASPSPPSLSQVEILETQHVWDQATARAQRVTPTAPPATESPSTPMYSSEPAPTAEPDLIYTADDLLPSPYTGKLPDGAVAVLGLGSVSASPSPDGRYFAVSSVEGVMVYDFNTLKPLWDAPKPSGGIMWLSDGKRIQIGRTIWKIETGASVWESSVSRNLSPNGEIIAQDNGDSTVSLYDRESGNTISVLIPPKDILSNPTKDTAWTTWVSFSPNSKLIATYYTWSKCGDCVDYAPVVAIWDVPIGKLLQTLDALPSDQVLWSPDSSKLVVDNLKGNLSVWDVQTGDQLIEDEESSNIWWSPDGSSFLNEQGQVWNTSTWQPQSALPVTYVGGAVWSPDSSRIATTSYEQIVTVWNTETQSRLITFPETTCIPCAFSADGTVLMTTIGWHNKVAVWNIGAEAPQLEVIWNGLSPVLDLDWSNDGRKLISAGGRYSEGQIISWDIRAQPTSLLTTGELGLDESASIEKLDLSPDEKRIAFSDDRGGGGFWNLESAKVDGHFTAPLGLAFSPSSQWFGFIVDSILNVETPDATKIVAQFELDNYNLTGFDWSPDSRDLAIAAVPEGDDLAKESHIIIISTDTGEAINEFSGMTGNFYSVAWSPDGTKIAAGLDQDIVAVWDAKSGKLLYQLSGGTPYHPDAAYVDLDWSPDGQLLAAAYGKNPSYINCATCGGTSPGAVVVWDVEKGERLYRFDWQQIEVQAVAFSPDGSLLASGGRNGTIVLWDMTHK